MARDRFRGRYREPVIKRYGSETGDLGVFVAECHACGVVDAIMKDFSFLARETSLSALKSALSAAALTQGGWRPDVCSGCGDPDLEPVVAILGRYLPENQADLQLELPFFEGSARGIEVLAAAEPGRLHALPSSMDPLQFCRLVGSTLSVRELWNTFIDRHLADDVLAAVQVQDGYCLGLRPFTDDPEQAAQMFEGLETVLEGYRGDWDVVTFLHDREEDGIPVTREQSYHTWLSEFSDDIRNGLLAPFVVADSGKFIEAVAELAARRGLFCAPDPDPDTLFCRISSGEVAWDINLGPCLFKTVHEGLSFSRGAALHLQRPLAAMSEASALPDVLRTCFPGWGLQVELGGKFVLSGDGQHFAGDLVALATGYDFSTAEGLEALLLHLGRHCRC